MKRNWLILLIIVATLAVPSGGKYLGMVILTALMPVYSLLLASIIFIIFLISALIAVPIGRKLMDRREARKLAEEQASQQQQAA